MISREEQLKNKANWIGTDGKICLRRCMNCPDSRERGIENYALNVVHGVCAWCGWEEKHDE